MTNLAKSDDPGRFDWIMHANRPAHLHQCLGDESHGPHAWHCDSPYCEIGPSDNCPQHGGMVPIRMGREPWRGR